MTHEDEHHLGEDLAALADDGAGLTPARRLELDRHVESCARCAAALTSARLVLRTVDEHLAPPEPSQAFDARLFQALDELDRRATREARAPSLFERLTAVLTLPRITALAGAAAAVALAVVLTRAPADDPLGPNRAVAEVGFAEDTGEALAIAEDLELLEDLEVVEDLDVLEDLELIESLDEGEPG